MGGIKIDHLGNLKKKKSRCFHSQTYWISAALWMQESGGQGQPCDVMPLPECG